MKQSNQIREQGDAPLQNALQMCQRNAVVGDGYILVGSTLHPVENLSAGQHAAAAMDHQLVVGQINHTVRIAVLGPAVQAAGNDTDALGQGVGAECAQRVHCHATKLIHIIDLVQVAVATHLPDPEAPFIESAIGALIVDLDGRFLSRRNLRSRGERIGRIGGNAQAQQQAQQQRPCKEFLFHVCSIHGFPLQMGTYIHIRRS